MANDVFRDANAVTATSGVPSMPPRPESDFRYNRVLLKNVFSFSLGTAFFSLNVI
jgi:hypothetical protein